MQTISGEIVMQGLLTWDFIMCIIKYGRIYMSEFTIVTQVLPKICIATYLNIS
jgi:hypothetical protein